MVADVDMMGLMSQGSTSSRTFVASCTFIAITSFCAACVLWYDASDTSINTNKEQNILSASSAMSGVLGTQNIGRPIPKPIIHDDVSNKASNHGFNAVKRSLHTALTQRSIATTKHAVALKAEKRESDALKSFTKVPPKAIAKVRQQFIDDAKMKAYLNEQKSYAVEEKRKEEAFRMKQKREAFVAEEIAKQATHKYDILTFPDKSLKNLKDYEDKSFPLITATHIDKPHSQLSPSSNLLHSSVQHQQVRQVLASHPPVAGTAPTLRVAHEKPELDAKPEAAEAETETGGSSL